MSVVSGRVGLSYPLPLLDVHDIKHGWRFCVPTNPGFCVCVCNNLAVWQVSVCAVCGGINSPVPPAECRLNPWVLLSLKTQQVARGGVECREVNATVVL